MPSYQSPGVYIHEVSGGSKPIASASTSTGAFIGIAEKGPINKAVFIANWTQFINTFGNFLPNGYLAYAVYSFFREGGSSCYVVRVSSPKAITAFATVPTGTKPDDAELVFTATSTGSWGNRITVTIEDPTTKSAETHFKMIVKYRESDTFKAEYKEVDEVTEKFDDFTLAQKKDAGGNPVTDPTGNPVYQELHRVNGGADGLGGSAFLRLKINPGAKRPANGVYTLANGEDGYGDADYINGLTALDLVDEILLIAIPDKAGDPEVIINGLAYCEGRQGKDCFFLADTPPGLDPQEAKAFRVDNGFNSSYGALYYPWVYVSDPLTSLKKLVPPSVLMGGIFAYTDNQRGVHKAPAGIEVGRVKTAIGLERMISKSEHDLLHPVQVNVIRTIPSAGNCVWGSYTLSADPEWKYINVRRLFIMLRVSIYRGTQWIVFEPNDRILWSKVDRNITAYLSGVWRTGALFGNDAKEAFFVKVDDENNPQDSIDRGELHIDIGVAPVKPAEFIIFTIRQKAPSE